MFLPTLLRVTTKYVTLRSLFKRPQYVLPARFIMPFIKVWFLSNRSPRQTTLPILRPSPYFPNM